MYYNEKILKKNPNYMRNKYITKYSLFKRPIKDKHLEKLSIC